MAQNPKNTLNFILLLLLCCTTGNAYGQEKTFVREYTYRASEMDSKNSCRTMVTNELRTQLLNELGVYVRSEQILATSEAGKNFSQNFNEQIVTVTAGITNLQILEEKWDGGEYYMKAAISIDKSDFAQKLAEVINNDKIKNELTLTRNDLEKANMELRRLRNQSNKDAYNDQVKLMATGNYSLALQFMNNLLSTHPQIGTSGSKQFTKMTLNTFGLLEINNCETVRDYYFDKKQKKEMKAKGIALDSYCVTSQINSVAMNDISTDDGFANSYSYKCGVTYAAWCTEVKCKSVNCAREQAFSIYGGGRLISDESYPFILSIPGSLTGRELREFKMAFSNFVSGYQSVNIR